MKKKLVIAISSVLAALIIPGLNMKLKTVRYEVDSEKIDSEFKIAFISDLHSCRYGRDQLSLINAVKAEAPDIVLFGGDIFDVDLPYENAEKVLKAIASEFKCYFVTGNHEYWFEPEDYNRILDTIKEAGITRLSNNCEQIKVNGTTLNLCGLDDCECGRMTPYDPQSSGEDYYKQIKLCRQKADEEHYTILLAHRPEYFIFYVDAGYDLVLTGHAHGGQIRIPGLMNGLYAPDQGFFPKMAGGKFRDKNTVMIVGRGLARESTLIPRFYNRPELVIVTAKPTA